ncbi:Hypothetical_protein [Hexamita inflata]|uniref:Hypothetical_protein n=1 Tax=Hexamita inflata TaxID=28002 RepID=A0AA86UNJ3_9EUKA|nr:Hypothetical protein HINF_LOCUS46172 [Hexamita inflata]
MKSVYSQNTMQKHNAQNITYRAVDLPASFSWLTIDDREYQACATFCEETDFHQNFTYNYIFTSIFSVNFFLEYSHYSGYSTFLVISLYVSCQALVFIVITIQELKKDICRFSHSLLTVDNFQHVFNIEEFVEFVRCYQKFNKILHASYLIVICYQLFFTFQTYLIIIQKQSQRDCYYYNSTNTQCQEDSISYLYYQVKPIQYYQN